MFDGIPNELADSEVSALRCVGAKGAERSLDFWRGELAEKAFLCF